MQLPATRDQLFAGPSATADGRGPAHFPEAAAVSQPPKWQRVLSFVEQAEVMRYIAGSSTRICRGPAALLASLQHLGMPVGTAQHAAQHLAVACETVPLISQHPSCRCKGTCLCLLHAACLTARGDCSVYCTEVVKVPCFRNAVSG